jgi:hypothetical protein
MDMGRLSRPIRLDLDFSKEGFSIKSTDKSVDSAPKALDVILKEYAKWTGLEVHRLPYAPTRGVGFLTRIVRMARKFHKAYEADREKMKFSAASPLANMLAMNALGPNLPMGGSGVAPPCGAANLMLPSFFRKGQARVFG